MTKFQGEFSRIVSESDYRVWRGVATIANQPSVTSPYIGAWTEARVAQLLATVSTSGSLRYIDPVAGNTANDALDNVVKASTTAFTWTESTKTLTKASAFASFTWFPGAKIYIVSGTGMTPGLYNVASKTSNNAIVLETSASSDGADHSSITVSSGPKATLADWNTLISSGTKRVLVRAGTEFVLSNTDQFLVGAVGCSSGTYGPGQNVLVTMRDTNQASGASWTASGNAYYVTRSGSTACGGVCEMGKPEFMYTRCSTVAECQNTPGSFFHDTGANRLYVRHLNSIALNNASGTVRMWFFPEADYPGSGNAKTTFYVNVNAQGFRLDNWDFVGCAMSVPSTKNGTVVQGELDGSYVFALVGCNIFGGSGHCFGNTSSTTGGIGVAVGCRFGGLTTDGTLAVGYAPSGGQEFRLLDCVFEQGSIRRIVAGVPTSVYGTTLAVGWLMHGNTSADLCAGGSCQRCRVTPGQTQVQDIGAVDHAPKSSSDPSAIKVFLIDCEFKANFPKATDQTYRPADTYAFGALPYQIAVGAGDRSAGWSTAHINCRYDCRCQFVNSTGDIVAALQQINGLHINGTFDIDWSAVDLPIAGGMLGTGLVVNATQLKCSWYHCHVNIRNAPASANGTAIIAWDAYGDGTYNQTYECPDKFEMFNTIVTVENPDKTKAFVGAGNNRAVGSGSPGAKLSPSRQVGLATNVPYSTGGNKGTDQIDGVTYVSDWSLGRVPKVGEIDYAQRSFLGSGQYIGFDSRWNLRRAGTTAMGPVEAIA